MVTDVVVFTAAARQPKAQMVTYRDVYTIHPLDFDVGMDTIINMRWIIDVESAFTMSCCLYGLTFTFALNILK